MFVVSYRMYGDMCANKTFDNVEDAWEWIQANQWGWKSFIFGRLVDEGCGILRIEELEYHLLES